MKNNNNIIQLSIYTISFLHKYFNREVSNTRANSIGVY